MLLFIDIYYTIIYYLKCRLIFSFLEKKLNVYHLKKLYINNIEKVILKSIEFSMNESR
jgi:hypothetical protein